MRTFAQKPKATQQTTSAKPTISGRAHFGHSREANSILHLQRSVGNQAVQRLLEANTDDVKGVSATTEIARFGHDFSRIPVHAPAEFAGPPSLRLPSAKLAGPHAALVPVSRGGGHVVPQELRKRVEVATGADLGGVRIHTGSAAQQVARMLNARAYTVGNDIHFARGYYHPGQREGDRLLAHELVHTIQQGSGAVPQTKLDISKPGDAAEVEADVIADSIIDGQAEAHGPMPMRISARRKAISRVEFKSGGAKFKLDPYAVVDSDNGKDSARQVGVNFDITYTSAETYRSDKIGFIQTMKTTKDNKPYLFTNEKPRATTAKEGEAGWAIDRLAGKKSPFYAQEDTGIAGVNTKFGYRKSKTDAKDAWMHDRLALNRAVGQKVTVDAVAFALDETNSKYLGGISWGFATDAKGNTKTKPAALKSTGDPSGIQKAALKKWNEQAALTDVSKRNAPDQEKVIVP